MKIAKFESLHCDAGWRTFSFLKKQSRPAQPVLVGIGYHFQEVATMTPNDWDVPMDFIATDRELIDCTSQSP